VTLICLPGRAFSWLTMGSTGFPVRSSPRAVETFRLCNAGDIIAALPTAAPAPGASGQTSDYNFTDSGATPNHGSRGISTAAGGNVTLIAGNNIDSTPKFRGQQAPGAFRHLWDPAM